MKEDAPQREHSLREVFNGLRYIVREGCTWRMLPHDLPPWFTIHQQATGASVKVAFADQGYTGAQPAEEAANQGVELDIVKLSEAKKDGLKDCGSFQASRMSSSRRTRTKL